MRIVILMGGVGSRFAAAGYQKPKPLIRVDGKTMAEHVVLMYPGEHEFILVSHERFANSEELRLLTEMLPRSRIVAVPPHNFGPVYTLSLVWNTLPENEPVLVSYCDFSANWDFADFIRNVEVAGIDGAIPSYTGFHPHLLHRKKYAGILANPAGMIEHIKEKHSFTPNPEDSFHSAGNYYFSKAHEMKHYGEALMRSGEALQGEYYLSMVYYHYLAEQKHILVYPLKHFLQWGTPEDLEEYEAWSRLIKGREKGVTDIPEGRRVHIPHADDSHEYQRSLAYWKEYFSL